MAPGCKMVGYSDDVLEFTLSKADFIGRYTETLNMIEKYSSTGMRVHGCGFQVGVAESGRHQGDWRAIVDRVRRVRVPQPVHRGGRVHAGELGRLFDDVVDRAFRE